MSEPMNEPSATRPPEAERAASSREIQVPSFAADVARVVATPFTVHVELGTTLPDGGVRLRAHVALPTAFARYLHKTLGEALALSDRAVAGALPGPEAAPEGGEHDETTGARGA
jgi:hypothetical protein